MRFSHTGQKAVLHQTLMHPEDVIELLSSDKVISLCTAYGREYLLYYSMPDKDAKVAIVSEGREVLISIQSTNCWLPYKGVRPDEGMINDTKRLLNQFIFEKANRGKPLGEDEFRVRIRITLKKRVVYESEISKTHYGEKPNEGKSIVLLLNQEFQKIVTVIEESGEFLGRISYLISVFDAESCCYRKGATMLRHKTLVGYLAQSNEVMEV